MDVVIDSRTPAERFQNFVDDPEAFRSAICFLTDGGTLVDFASDYGIRYSDLMDWIRLDKTREKRYYQALTDRAEWAKETVYSEIKMFALGKNAMCKPQTQLKALEMLGKVFGMFVEHHEHTGKMTLEDLVAGSREAKDAT